jgi:signal transduction histidine kinase/CheY-like chemotaxis protein
VIGCQATVTAQNIKGGFVDLRGIDLNEPITLNGEWHFFWQELVSPTSTPPKDSEFVNLPGLWNELEEAGFQPHGFATYQVRVLLDPKVEYAIFTPAVYSSYRFFINGNLITSNGNVGIDEDSTKPQWIQLTEPIPSEILADTNIFTLQVSNFSHYRGGPADSIILGEKKSLLSSRNALFVLDAMLSGALIMGGMFFLGLFLFGRRQRNILYFSLFCLAFSYFIFGRVNYLVTWMFPDLPWWLTTRMEYGFIYLMVIFLLKYTYNTYPQDSPKYLDQIVVWISLVFLIVNIASPPMIFTRLLPIFLTFMFVIIPIGFYIYLKALLNKRPGAVYSFIGISIILSVLTLANLKQFGLIDLPPYVAPIGYMLFFFLQSVTTSQQVSISYEKNRLEAEAALRAKSDFLSTMSHEIRTPMNAVIGLTHHLIYSHPRLDQLSTLNTLKFSSENLLRLLNDILDYNKLEAGGLMLEANLIDLQTLGNNLADGFRKMAEAKKTMIEFEFDQKLPSLFTGDEGRLTQVLSNFIDNAIKFTSAGKVTLAMSLAERQPEYISIRFSVKDTGIGISHIDRQKIFEQFNQANSSINRTYGGTGLGLAISKRILELQSVEIHLESELGQGSEFYFTMDLKLAKGHGKRVVKPSILVDPLKDKRILLVEDNQVNIMLASRFLEKWHCLIDLAENGEQAVDKFEEDKYDLILMDLQMPIMDGYEATRRIRATGSKIPIIALTATALVEKGQSINDYGLDDFIVKPFHPNHLYEKLTKYLVENEPGLS